VERALIENAVLAGTACEWCGDTEDVQKRRACFCDDLHATGYEGFTRRDDQPVCSGCWTPANIVNVCRRCRKNRGEDAANQCNECGAWLTEDGDGIKYCYANAQHRAVAP
jgi:hypothetical protein